ncbi:MAG: dihydroorotase, partial [Dehalococcoidales bacterium]
MTQRLLIRGGRLIDPGQKLDTVGSLFVEDGRISRLAEAEPDSPGDCDVLDAEGLVVCPGFIDLHCHLREPGQEEKETSATGTRAAARGGFTTVCCMPNTLPPLDSREVVDRLMARVARDAVVRVLPVACVTRGRNGEKLVDMASLVDAGVVGFSDDGDPVTVVGVMRRALELSVELGRPVIDHCEDKTLTAGGVINAGAAAETLGVVGMPAHAEELLVARDLELAKATGGWLHVAHVSTESAVELVRLAKVKGLAVTAEVTPHHLTLTEEEVILSQANAKVNPPLRTGKDVRALVDGLRDGTIDAIATDHAPHTEAEKQRGLADAPFGFSVLETAFGSAMSLVHAGHLPLAVLIERLTTGPARILGENGTGLGTLAVGSVADITIIDTEREWLVDPAEFASKGKNTPLSGRTLKGRVVATLAGGKLVHSDDS